MNDAQIQQTLAQMSIGAEKWLVSDGHIDIVCKVTGRRRRFSEAFADNAAWLFNWLTQSAEDNLDY